MKRKVIITGIGTITPSSSNGLEYIQYINSYLEENHVIMNIKQCIDSTILKTDYCVQKVLPRADKACSLLLETVKQIDSLIFDAKDTGVIMASTYGLLEAQYNYLMKLHETGIAFPTYFQAATQNLLSGIIAYKYHLSGFNLTLIDGETSACDAIVLASSLITCGDITKVIVGGVDTKQSILLGRNKSNFNSSVISEASGAIVLEAMDENNNDESSYIIDYGQGNFYSEESIGNILNNVLEKNKCVDYYFSNLEGTHLERYEKDILSNYNMKKKSLIPVLGNCMSTLNIMNVIYASSLKNEISIIFSAGNFGKYSYLVMKGGGQ